jgi:hypothetical protein
MELLDDMNNMKELYKNPNAIHLIKSFFPNYNSKEYLNYLCSNTNPEALQLLEEYINKLDDYSLELLCKNEGAMFLIKKYINKIHFICLGSLYSNPNAIPIIEKCYILDYNSFIKLCYNPNPNAISIIEKNLDKIWVNLSMYNKQKIMISLCQNPNAIHIIEQHQDILDNECWKELLINPSIFSTDTMSYVFK